MRGQEDLGDFEEIQDERKKPVQAEETFTRARLPRGKEVIGVVSQRLGGNRMEIRTSSGKMMNCRVPGRFKRSMWLKIRDVVLVEPWKYDSTKGDVIFKYNSSAINQLRKKGLLGSAVEEF